MAIVALFVGCALSMTGPEAAPSAKGKRAKVERVAARADLRRPDSVLPADELIALPIRQGKYEAVHYKFETTVWKLPFIRDSGLGGPFELIGPNRMLFLSRCGTLSVVERQGDTLELRHSSTLPFAGEIHCGGGPEGTMAGVKGLLLSRVAGDGASSSRRTAYIAFSHEPTPGCAALKLVKLEVSIGEEVLLGEKTDLLVSSPCGRQPVLYNEVGGALAQNASHVFLSVGDFGQLRPAGAISDHGRIYRFAKGLERPRAELFAEGVRNPEGMTFAPAQPDRPTGSRLLYATDMGPKGGDEVNVITKGDNLGFPQSSYGIEYGHNTRTHYTGQFDRHDKGKKPLLVFMPSVAPTGIAYYDGQMFRSWRHSLIMTTLRGRTLYRLRLDEGRVAYAEPIADTRERMRHLQIAPDGGIYVKADPDLLIHVFRRPEQGEQQTP